MAGNTPERPASITIAVGPLNGRANDVEAGFEILDDFERFDQKNDIFRRSWRDKAIRNEKSERFYATHREPLRGARRAEGFSQKDYALRNAAWHVSDLFTDFKQAQDRREGFTDTFTLQHEPAAEKTELGTPEEAATEIKRVAKSFGAALVGITQYDRRWEYKRKFSDMSLTEGPPEIPDGLNQVIVVAQAMDYDWIRTAPSALSGAATGLGYSHDALVVLSVAQYIRNLGYEAVGSMNDTSLAIPYAIKAGLGEYGRHGLLITKEYGPRVRLGKIYTNLPLAYDRPIRFGVQEFCTICRQCANGCPVKAIPMGEPESGGYSHSNIKGVRKWTVHAEKCFGFWIAQNSDCTICLRVCSYNKDYRLRRFRVGRWLAGTRLRRVMLWLDIRLGYGERLRPRYWWRARKDKAGSRLWRLLPGGSTKRRR